MCFSNRPRLRLAEKNDILAYEAAFPHLAKVSLSNQRRETGSTPLQPACLHRTLVLPATPPNLLCMARHRCPSQCMSRVV